MKKIFISFVAILFFIIPGGVGAKSVVSIKCEQSEIIASDTLSCTLSSTVDEGISYNKLEGSIEVSNSSFITFASSDVFSANINDNKISINSTSLVENTTIGNLQIKFNDDATSTNTIKLSNLKLYKDDSEVASLSDTSATVKVKSTVNTLESLSVSNCNNCKISPSFKKTITIYSVTTETPQIKISAKASGNATVSGTGIKELTKDMETFVINVTSESGSTKSYRLIVSKKSNLSSDTSLKSLTIDKGTLTPMFSNDVTNYTSTVDSDKVIIKAEKNDSKSKVMGDGEKKLSYGLNEFTIIVAAEDGTTKSYLININRPDTRNANAYLKELTINGEDISFEKDVIEYSYNVDKDTDELEIKAIAELESSSVEIEGNEKFKLGENIITITVKAEDGSEKKYKIVVIKGDKPKGKVYLDELKINNYDIDFSKDKFEYSLTIKNEKLLDIYTSAEPGYDIEIVGNKDLKDGSIVKVIVTDEEGNNSIYKISINKASSNNISNDSSDINYIPIIMTSLLVILFIIDTVLLIKRIKNK